MFRENKTLAKTSEFTVSSILLAYRKACRINRMSPKFQGSVACYPYSTQATNRQNRHELIFFLFGGVGGGGFVRFHYFFFSNRDEVRVIPDSDTMSLRIFGGIGSIRLESRKNSLRFETNIRTCCTKVKEPITNQLRIC